MNDDHGIDQVVKSHVYNGILCRFIRPRPSCTPDDNNNNNNEQKGLPQHEQVDQHSTSSKKRKRGQNKKRPVTTSYDKRQLLCPKLIADEVCEFGDSCRFSHDVDNFLQSKPPDIGNSKTFKNFSRLIDELAIRRAMTVVISNQMAVTITLV